MPRVGALAELGPQAKLLVLDDAGRPAFWRDVPRGWYAYQMLPRWGTVSSTMTARVTAYEARLSVQGDEPAFNEDGVDLTQLRRFLALTPLERLVWAEQAATEIDALRSMARVQVSAHASARFLPLLRVLGELEAVQRPTRGDSSQRQRTSRDRGMRS